MDKTEGAKSFPKPTPFIASMTLRYKARIDVKK
jgi:hypothetical protein